MPPELHPFDCRCRSCSGPSAPVRLTLRRDPGGASRRRIWTLIAVGLAAFWVAIAVLAFPLLDPLF